MLKTLNVTNFAIIDNLCIDFSDDMTVITGETGAGKSLIIDAISLLLGERATKELIRHGEAKATIEGYFTKYDLIIPLLEKYEITYEEEEYLVIKREIFDNGKSNCKINNQSVSLSQLKEIGTNIADIHSQLDTFGLINPKNYLNFLNNDIINNLLNDYSISLKKYQKAMKKYEEMKTKNNDDIQKIDFLKFQINELEKASLNVEEEQLLKQELNTLNNYEQLVKNIQEIKSIIDNNTLDNIYETINILKRIEQYDEYYSQTREKIEENYYNLDDLYTNIFNRFNKFDFDLDKINIINERLGIYSDLKRKYRKDTNELILFLETLKSQINEIENYDDIILQLEKEVNDEFNNTLGIAKTIREERKKIALFIEDKILENLQDLELKNTIFKIEFNEIKDITFYPNGIDTVDFLVSFNKGEPLKLLNKTASGGELSRFMLAMKVVLGDMLQLQTKIFDEIDSGVNGKIASAIAKKIKQLAKNAQVLCITHLPQVACIGKQHIHISKKLVNNRTITNLEYLDNSSRINEIARMISNGNITKNSVSLAEELLKDSQFGNN